MLPAFPLSVVSPIQAPSVAWWSMARIVTGPAIVEEYGATTVVYPGQRIVTDRFGNLVLTRGAA